MTKTQEESLLLSLSTEVLLLILNFLPENTLLVTSKVSQRLYHLALPIYLSRFGITNPDPTSLTLHSRNIAALPGLCISSITQLGSLSCTFDGPSGSRFTRSMESFLTFVHGLSKVNSVKLDLRTVDARWVDDFITANATRWIPIFRRLLDIILEQGCSSLTIINGYLTTYPEGSAALHHKLGGHGSTDMRRSRCRQAPVSATRFFLGKHMLPISRQDRHVEREPPSYDLTTLDIRSDIMLSPHLYDWTLDVLNACNITSLSFRHLSGLSSQAWAQILSSIAVPTLKKLVLETNNINFPDLVDFLLRHPSIIALNLHPYFTCLNKQKHRTKERILPQLASLGGSPNNIATFLDHSLHSTPQLHLHSIMLTLPVHQRVLLPSDVESFSQRIGHLTQHVKPILLSLQFSIPHNEKLSAAAAALRDAPAETHLVTAFRTIETLVLSSDRLFAFTRWVIPVLPEWLVNFVSLKRVEFANDCFPEDVDDCANFVALIRKSCPKLSTICFGDNMQHF